MRPGVRGRGLYHAETQSRGGPELTHRLAPPSVSPYSYIPVSQRLSVSACHNPPARNLHRPSALCPTWHPLATGAGRDRQRSRPSLACRSGVDYCQRSQVIGLRERETHMASRHLGKRIAGAAVALGITVVAAVPVAACQVPVFRYALERWEPDTYQAVIVHDGPLTPEQHQLVTRLGKAANSSHGPINLSATTVDASLSEHVRMREALPASVRLPAIVLQYPAGHSSSEPAWIGELTANHIEQLVDSPLRQEMVQRLLAGDSAVWVLVECGDAAQDAHAWEVLTQALTAAQSKLTLPTADELKKDEWYRSDNQVPLRLAFSAVRLRVHDEHEHIFGSLLRHSEEGLAEITTPLAIPVYGRGRTHYALAGRGIQPDNILEHCRFVIGACSCQVKVQNPGVDLPLAAAWTKWLPAAESTAPVFQSLIARNESTKDDPQRSGVQATAEKDDRALAGDALSEPLADSATAHSIKPSPVSPKPLKAVAYLLVGILILVAGVTVYLRRE